MKFQKKWSEADIETLRELAKTGMSFKQIGAIIGYSGNACVGKARREKIDKALSDLTPRPKKFVPKKEVDWTIKHKLIKPTPIPPDIKAPDMLLIPMMELTKNNCRYPIGEDENMLFCGLPKTKGKPYCKHHAKICYKPMVSFKNLMDQNRERHIRARPCVENAARAFRDPR